MTNGHRIGLLEFGFNECISNGMRALGDSAP
jgi:hypothetical protein